MENKRGQFYLIATVIIIAIIAGFAFVSNYSVSKTSTIFQYVEEEVSIEGAKVVDYAIANDKDSNELLKNFTKDYSTYSDADSLYFIFGKLNNITLAGYSRLNPSTIVINFGSGDQQVSFSQGVYQTFNYNSTSQNIKITIENAGYSFNLSSLENFYFVISKNIDGERYVATNEDSGFGIVSEGQTAFTQLTCIQYIIPQFCSNVVNCPQGSQLFGDITSCDCNFLGLGCKSQYTCVYFQTTSCMQNPECPDGYSYYSSQTCNP